MDAFIVKHHFVAIGSTVLLSLLACWVYYRYRSITYLRRLGFPSPPAHWLLGNMPTFSKISRRQFHSGLLEKYGKVCGFHALGPRPIVLVADRQVASAILVKEFGKFTDRVVRLAYGEGARLPFFLEGRGIRGNLTFARPPPL